jgi:phage baseplate assembly protein W
MALAATFSWIVVQASAGAGSSGSGATRSSGLSDPLGNGILRPFRRTVHADFATASGVKLVLSDIGQLLGTPIRRLPWRHDFGADLQPLRHKGNTEVLAELARVRVEEAIRKFAFNVELRSVRVERPKPNMLIVWATLVIGGKVHNLRVPV